MDKEVINKINEFFRASLKCYGKEVGLYSNQFFGIDQIREADCPEDVTKFAVQYGFPQSGCVFLNFSYSKGTHEFVLADISVYAPDDSKELVLANIDTQSSIMEEVSAEVKTGIDMETIERAGIAAISQSVNAMGMLDLAIADLQKAEILGECMLNVPADSDRIPCCDSHQINNDMGTR